MKDGYKGCEGLLAFSRYHLALPRIFRCSEAQRLNKLVYQCLWDYLIEFEYNYIITFNLTTHFQYVVSGAENSKTKFILEVALS